MCKLMNKKNAGYSLRVTVFKMKFLWPFIAAWANPTLRTHGCTSLTVMGKNEGHMWVTVHMILKSTGRYAEDHTHWESGLLCWVLDYSQEECDCLLALSCVLPGVLPNPVGILSDLKGIETHAITEDYVHYLSISCM